LRETPENAQAKRKGENTTIFISEKAPGEEGGKTAICEGGVRKGKSIIQKKRKTVIVTCKRAET